MVEEAVVTAEEEVQEDPHTEQRVITIATITRQRKWNLHHIKQERHKVQHMTL